MFYLNINNKYLNSIVDYDFSNTDITMKLPKPINHKNYALSESAFSPSQKRLRRMQQHKHVVGYCNQSSKIKSFSNLRSKSPKGGLKSSVESSGGLLFAYNPSGSYNEMMKNDEDDFVQYKI